MDRSNTYLASVLAASLILLGTGSATTVRAAGDVRPVGQQAGDTASPDGVAKAFVAAFERDDVAAARKLVSARIRAKLPDDAQLKTFLAGWRNEGKVLSVDGSDPPQERDGKTSARVRITYERKGAAKTATVRVAKEGGQWRWDET